MGKFARVVAFLFRLLNFFFDCLQTWQFTGGGGMSGIVAGAIGFYQGLPYWTLPVIAVVAGVVVVVLLALIFKSFTTRRLEDKELPKLPRLVLSIHNRINTVRNKLIQKTDWDSVDSAKVVSPILDVFGSTGVNNDTVNQLREKLVASGSPPSGIASVSDSFMKESDTSLDRALRKDFPYRFLTARLDGYKPYPNEDIGNLVSQTIQMSISINNMIILQEYASDAVSLETLDSLTTLSDVKKMQVYNTNVLAEDKMNDAVDKATTKLRQYVDAYISERSKK